MKFFSSERLRPVVIGAGVGFIFALAAAVGLLSSWSAQATDRLFLPHAADPRITVVAIDDASITQLGRWPWPRDIHAQIIQKLSDAGAKVIAYDVNFPEASDPTDDASLEAALKSSGRVILPVELSLTTAGNQLSFDPTKTVAPIADIASTAASTGHTNTPPDADGIFRRLPLSVVGPNNTVVPSFIAEAARLFGIADHVTQAPVDAQDRMVVNFPGAPFQAFRTISAADVVRGRADLSGVNGGIVFVGATAADLHDALLVPTSNGNLMPGVEIHASSFNTLLTQDWLQPVPAWASFLLLVLLGLLVGVCASRLRIRTSLIVIVVAWIALIVASLILFDRGWIVDPVWPTLTLAAAFTLVTLERRITADRARRELKAAFSRYVSPSVVKHILDDPSKLELGGERRRMSVLFSDIRGFTTISEGLSPEKLVDVLNIYLSRMTDLVFQHEGVLDKYIGDAVMAFWNAPFDQKDHAMRAVTTALDMQRALAEMNSNKAFGDLELHIGLGVNTGDMVVGNVGGKARFDYTVIGDNVNLGSRLEGLTKEYGVQVLVSEATQQEIANDILTRRIDKVAVKGKKEPVIIYEAICPVKDATAAERALIQSFEAALALYFARNFAGTVEACDNILKTSPDDGPTKNLKERSLHFKDNPPDADWVGTWVMTKK